jgi:hypothetical protein
VYLKSLIVADLLNVSYARLIFLIKTKRMPPPGKDSSGDYTWSERDVARARAALSTVRQRRLPEVAASGK